MPSVLPYHSQPPPPPDLDRATVPRDAWYGVATALNAIGTALAVALLVLRAVVAWRTDPLVWLLVVAVPVAVVQGSVSLWGWVLYRTTDRRDYDPLPWAAGVAVATHALHVGLSAVFAGG
ncbi:MAG TPA: hypothetical protein VF796_11875 [Humisphaera sp.]